MVIGADRLMRCNVFAWTYHDQYYVGTSHDRLSDPLANHLAWVEPPVQRAQTMTIKAHAGNDTLEPARPEPSLAFAERLYAHEYHAEAATEFLRVRFSAASPRLRDYAGLMAGESYLGAQNPARALQAFQTTSDAVRDFAAYGAARARFSGGQMTEARAELEAMTDTSLARKADYLTGWTWYRTTDFARGSGCFARWTDDTLAVQLAALDGRGLALRSRTVSTALSSIVPGLGHVYSGRTGDGVYTFLTVASTGLLTWWFLSDSETRDRAHVGASVFGALTALFYAGNVYGANVAARDYNVLQKRRYLGRAESLLGRLRLEPDYRHLRDSLNPDIPAAAAGE
jgi:hypothetical protein